MTKLGNLVDVSRSRLDSWYNALTGLGNNLRDKVKSTQFTSSTRLPDATLDNLYHEDDVAARVCEALPEDALRKGFYLSAEEDTELSSLLQEYDKRLGFAEALEGCAIWARVFGGAVVYLGIDDGLPESEPVNEERIQSICFTLVLDKRHIRPTKTYSDPQNDTKYGMPELYQIQSIPSETAGEHLRQGEIVHETRIIRLNGARTSLERRQRNSGWHESVLQKVYDTLVQFSISWQVAGHLLQDAAQGVFKIEGLMEMIAGGDKDLLQSRMELVDMSRSVARAIMLDAEKESFTREAYTFTGLSSMMEMWMLRMAAAARMPVMVLMGQKVRPGGLNATADADVRLWYDQIQAYQRRTLGPAIVRFYTLVFAAQDFEGAAPKTWGVLFERLWQMTDAEQAELEKAVADKDKIYIDSQVLLPEEVTLNRFKARGFSMDTQVDLEARREMLEAEIALAKEKAGEDPIPPPGPGGAPGEPPPPEPEE